MWALSACGMRGSVGDSLSPTLEAHLTTAPIDGRLGTRRYSWNKGQLDKARNEGNKQTNPWATAVGGVVRALPTALLVIASITKLQNTRYNKWYVFGVLSGGFWIAIAVVAVIRRMLLLRYQYRLWRMVRTIVALAVIAFWVCELLVAWGVGEGRAWHAWLDA